MNSTTAVIGAAIGVVALMAVLAGLMAFVAARRAPPEAYQHYEHTLADMQQRLERTERRSDRQQEQIDRLREMLAAEQDYSRALARAMREAGLEPPPRPADPPPRPPDGTEGLARRLAACYSLSELDMLADELELENVLTGDSLETRTTSLVKAALRRGNLSELVAIARRDRPRGGF